MNKSFHIHSYGKSANLKHWEYLLNKTSFINRLYYILEEGAGYIVNGEKHYFLKNHIYLLTHCASATFFIEKDSFSHIFINYTDDYLSGYDKIIDISTEKCEIIKADTEVFISYLNRELEENPGKHKFCSNERISLILSSFLYDINQLYTPSKLKNPLIAESIKYIRTNFSNNITVRELADRAFLSKNQFSNVFLKETGVTPYQYIKDYRFSIATSMLKSGIPVSEVAQKCGFLSCAAFSSSFKKKFGCSPSTIDFMGR